MTMDDGHDLPFGSAEIALPWLQGITYKSKALM
jgi:hypothetical protein